MAHPAARAGTATVRRAWALLAWAVALALAVILGWRIVAVTVASQQAARHPKAALARLPEDPAALLALARQQLAHGEPAAAAATARRLLRHAPLQGDGFAVLADAARLQGHVAQADALYAIAVRRAPRNTEARTQLIAVQLRAGRYADALRNVNVLMQSASWLQPKLVPLLAQLATDPRFADALVQVLASQPAWSGAMYDALLAHPEAAATDRVLGALAIRQALPQATFAQWLAALGAADKWGEAYALWVGNLHLKPGARLPLVHDGDFADQPSGAPFDWAMGGEPGTFIERVPPEGTAGSAARVVFTGRRADEMHFGQVLLLAPGPYRLQFQARAEFLHSDQGLEWAIQCIGSAAPIAVSDPLRGTFDWTGMHVDFVVPGTGCEAQRLALVNPGAAAAGKVVSGTLWITGFALDPARTPR